MGVLAVADGDHAAELAIGEEVDRHIRERDRRHLVEGVRIAGPQVVGQVAVDGLDPGAPLELIGERLADVDLVSMPEGIRLPHLAELPASPDGALAGDQQRVVRRVERPVVGEEGGERVEVEGRLGNDAARARDVRGVPGCVAGVAAEDPKDTDALVAAERRALAVDQLLGPGHRRREPDAVLGAVDVVIHRLRDGDHREALFPDARRVAQRVVAPDRHERTDPEPLKVLEDEGREVELVLADAHLLTTFVVQPVRQPRRTHRRRVGPRGVEDGAAGPIDGPRAGPVEVPQEPATIVEIGVHVGQPLPAAPDAQRFPANLARAVHDALDDRVQARNIAPAGEDSDAFHHVVAMLPDRAGHL